MRSRYSVGLQAQRGGARQGVGRDEGAGVVLDAIDAVGVGRQHPDARLALQRMAHAQQELGGPAAAARAPLRRLTVTVVSPPERITQGLRERLAARRDRARERRMHLAHLARLALDLVARTWASRPRRARHRGRGLQRLLRRGDHVHLVAGEARRRRASGVSKAPLSRPARGGRGTSMP